VVQVRLEVLVQVLEVRLEWVKEAEVEEDHTHNLLQLPRLHFQVVGLYLVVELEEPEQV
jgi:hypothetical protein